MVDYRETCGGSLEDQLFLYLSIKLDYRNYVALGVALKKTNVLAMEEIKLDRKNIGFFNFSFNRSELL
ncbi:MAG TPA: hypothetical protein VN426_06945 [Syntrophomonadaceae bacterium]|nr:hypothetical protein [Syntrophomonadaceae bacterium]